MAVTSIFSNFSNVAGTVVLTVPAGVTVPVGGSVVVATDRGDAASSAGGIASIVDSKANTWVLHDAISLRSGTVEVALHHMHVATGKALAPGDTITVTWNANAQTRKGAVAHVADNLDTAQGAMATSGTTVSTNPTSSGPNGGSGSSASGSTLAATTQASGQLFGAFGSGVTATTPGSGFTAGGTAATTGGTADRQVTTEYRTLTTTGVKTAGTTFTTASSWAAAVAAYPTTGAANTPPTANAGPDQTNVEPWSTVTLTGTDADSDGTIASRSWTQTGGPAVTLTGSGATRTFEAPATVAGTTLTFQYSVTDDDGAVSTPDTVTVTVLPAAERILIGGSWVPCRIRLV